MKTILQALCAATLVSLLAGQTVLAQPSGLRLDGSARGIVLRDTENGLRLSFSSHPTTSDSWWNTDAASQDGSHNTLSADWPLDLGVHTSLGLSWDTARSGTAGKTTASPPATFFGLGWNSEPSRSTRWALSAEVGTHLTAGSNSCRSILMSCVAAQPAGLSGNAMGSGLRLTPYVSFGATYSFDR